MFFTISTTCLLIWDRSSQYIVRNGGGPYSSCAGKFFSCSSCSNGTSVNCGTMVTHEGSGCTGAEVPEGTGTHYGHGCGS